jgi:cytochrome P450
LFLLLSHPDQFQAVQADHDLIAPAIEEGLRFETPLTTVQRYVAEPTELEGVVLPEGAVIDTCIGSANRDEQRWERSDVADDNPRIWGHPFRSPTAIPVTFDAAG